MLWHFFDECETIDYSIIATVPGVLIMYEALCQALCDFASWRLSVKSRAPSRLKLGYWLKGPLITAQFQ